MRTVGLFLCAKAFLASAFIFVSDTIGVERPGEIDFSLLVPGENDADDVDGVGVDGTEIVSESSETSCRNSEKNKGKVDGIVSRKWSKLLLTFPTFCPVIFGIHVSVPRIQRIERI